MAHVTRRRPSAPTRFVGTPIGRPIEHVTQGESACRIWLSSRIVNRNMPPLVWKQIAYEVVLFR